jgi:hypothetical protein
MQFPGGERLVHNVEEKRRARVTSSLRSFPLFALGLLFGPLAYAASESEPAPKPPQAKIEITSPQRMADAAPEGRVEIKGKNFPTDVEKIKVLIGDKPVKPEEAKAESIVFRVPKDTPLERYIVALQVAGSEQRYTVPGELRVVHSTFAVASDTRLPDVMPDERVQIKVDRLPAQRGNLLVIIGDKPGINPEQSDEKSLTFRVPRDIAPGRYSVVVESSADPKGRATVPGELRVKPKEAPKITAITPITGYPQDGVFNFRISGENFGQTAADNDLLINNVPLTKAQRDDTACAQLPQQSTVPQKWDKPCLAVVDSTQLQVFGVKAEPYQGPVKVQVRTYGATSTPPAVATLSRIREGAVLPLAVALTALLGAILLYAVWRGIGTYQIAGKPVSPTAMFLLDKDTNTYSLSKFQLLAWTTAAVFGYIYLMTANLLIQWKFALPDLPDGLPLLLGVSAGTTVAAIGLNSHVGGKGSGPVSPSPADFITTGGIVAPERLQFFIWTLIGIGGFLSLLIAADPSTLQKLPSLPENFLTIMGISSATYLGGKAIRKPGPDIKSLSVATVTEDMTKLVNPKPKDPATPDAKVTPPRGPVLVVNVKGENLDVTGTVKIDETNLRTDQFWLTAKKVPDGVTGRTTDLDINLDVGLIKEVGPNVLEGPHTITLSNRDAQSTSAVFPIDPMDITEVTQKSAAGATPVVLSVSGKNFGELTTGEWLAKSATGQPEKIPATAIKRASPTTLEITFTPTNKGAGALTLISPVGLKISKPLTIA